MIPPHIFDIAIICLLLIVFTVYHHFSKKTKQTIITSDYYIGLYYESNKKDFEFVELSVNDNDYHLIFNFSDIKFKCSGYYAIVHNEDDSKRNMKFISDLLGAEADNKKVSVSINSKTSNIIYRLLKESDS